MVDNLIGGWNFKSLNRDDDISSHMLSDNNVKTELRLYAKNFITVNRTEISPRFEQTELKFSFHVNKLKIIM